MTGWNGPGPLMGRLLSWLAVLTIGGLVLQIMLTELVRWVTLLAPWVLLLLFLGGASFAICVVIRRYFYRY